MLAVLLVGIVLVAGCALAGMAGKSDGFEGVGSTPDYRI